MSFFQSLNQFCSWRGTGFQPFSYQRFRCPGACVCFGRQPLRGGWALGWGLACDLPRPPTKLAPSPASPRHRAGNLSRPACTLPMLPAGSSISICLQGRPTHGCQTPIRQRWLCRGCGRHRHGLPVLRSALGFLAVAGAGCCKPASCLCFERPRCLSAEDGLARLLMGAKSRLLAQRPSRTIQLPVMSLLISVHAVREDPGLCFTAPAPQGSRLSEESLSFGPSLTGRWAGEGRAFPPGVSSPPAHRRVRLFPAPTFPHVSSAETPPGLACPRLWP